MGVDEHERVIDFVEKPQGSAAHARQAGPRAGQMGVYIFNAEFLYEQLIATPRRSAPATTSARTSFPTSSPRYRVFAHASPTPASAATTPRGFPTGATSAPSTPTGKPTWS
jgi:glucose-1-phosphate adenylyltransferase